MHSPYGLPQSENQPPAIRAELSGVDTCAACGVTAVHHAPILTLCRALVERGHDPATPLECYRGDTLCLNIRSIGQAARLEINAHGTGFIARRDRRTAPPMRPLRLTVITSCAA